MGAIHLLTDKRIRESNPPAGSKLVLRDGGNLFLQVRRAQDGVGINRSWIFRYERDGHQHPMGLGAYPEISLATARDLARAARAQLAVGVNPLLQRKQEKAARRLAAASTKTFDEVRDEYIKANRDGWRSAKHAAQWHSSLARFVTPVLGTLPVQMVDRVIIIKALKPIWRTKSETASRVRERVERILTYAEVHGYRPEGSNPARRDAIKIAMGKQPRKVKHHAAIAYQALPDFMIELRARPAIAARALEFAILTCARTAEIIGATWDEIDLAGKLWIIPPERMKSWREHRVVLSDSAARVIEQMDRDVEHVFPGPTPGAALSNMAMLTLLRRMGREGITTHGMRAAFKTWATEQTSFERELAEVALAHTLGKLDLAYQRGPMVAKRRELMAAWAQFIDSGIQTERQQAAG
jgi:integrase